MPSDTSASGLACSSNLPLPPSRSARPRTSSGQLVSALACAALASRRCTSRWSTQPLLPARSCRSSWTRSNCSRRGGPSAASRRLSRVQVVAEICVRWSGPCLGSRCRSDCRRGGSAFSWLSFDAPRSMRPGEAPDWLDAADSEPELSKRRESSVCALGDWALAGLDEPCEQPSGDGGGASDCVDSLAVCAHSAPSAALDLVRDERALPGLEHGFGTIGT
mmetsp:Transcript_48773/g.115857  ORF Transcript_48773/g.115857 Transcript_48773/m.115857 type:complete len:220 (-) Transcript_48773:421-1080(-)